MSTGTNGFPGIEFDPKKSYGECRDFIVDSTGSLRAIERSGEIQKGILAYSMRNFIPEEHQHRIRWTQELRREGASRVGWVYDPLLPSQLCLEKVEIE